MFQHLKALKIKHFMHKNETLKHFQPLLYSSIDKLQLGLSP